jgi:hypothetical protein
MTKDEALKLALEALETIAKLTGARWALEQGYAGHLEAITAINQALAAQPAQQEPVAWLMYKGEHAESFWFDKGDAYNFEMTPEHRWEPLYTTPPQSTWVGLTDEEKHEIELKAGITEDDDGYIVSQVFKLTEAKLKEKNGT